MRYGFAAALVSVLFAVIFSSLLTACDGKNGPAGPAGQPVTILVTPTPSVPPHSFLGVWGSQGTAAGQFYYPEGLWVDVAGNIYVAEGVNNRIQLVPSVGNSYIIWGSTAGGTTPGQFSLPLGVTQDPAGNLWVADTGNNRLQELPLGSSNWVTIGAVAGGTGPGQFTEPFYLAFDGAGDLIVSDDGNNRLQELPTGLAASVPSNWITIGGLAAGTTPGTFNGPSGVAFDPSGNLWVADQVNNRLQELPAGKAATVAANWVTIGGPGSGPGQFNDPSGLGTDPSGDVYVAEIHNNRLQELPAGKAATVAANWVTIGSGGSGPGQFSSPYDVKTDSAGNVYVADQNNNRIQKLSP